MKKNRWDDHYTRRARKEKWLARSVYKLKEIDNRFKLIRPGDRVLDLGCYPGSWSQYALQKAGMGGEVAGIDIARPDRLPSRGFSFIQADVTALDIEGLARELLPRDLVLSDLAPSTTGIGAIDAGASMVLAQKALEIARAVLAKGGRFVCKILEGGELGEFKKDASTSFNEVRLFRPGATRKRSREVYLIGRDFSEKSGVRG